MTATPIIPQTSTSSFQLPDYLWEPQKRGILGTIRMLEAGKDVCLYSPTGGGKTEQAIHLFRWAQSRGGTGIFYVNRRLLVEQTARRFIDNGLGFGVRAAGYEDMIAPDAPFQISSAQTEASRVFRQHRWNLAEADLVIVDEAHLQKTQVMRKLLHEHRQRGARVVLLTATPIGLSKWVDTLVISGSMSDYRQCKAIVPAIVRSPNHVDLSRVKRTKVGEFILDGKRRSIFIQAIIGDVIGAWRRFNPDARPTLLYAPGVAESMWFTDRFQEAGVPWCHVDATEAYIEGKRYTLTRGLWLDILGKYAEGRIKGISCRFKLREGIDIPYVWHCILATPIGSIASYLQTVGRVLRYSKETPDNVLVTDHGGNYLRLGSPNVDRPWRKWWDMPEGKASLYHTNAIKRGEVAEPICCPNCFAERLTGIQCPICGFQQPRSKRRVIMLDGTLVEKEGYFLATKPKEKPFSELRRDTQRKWNDMYWAYKTKQLRRTFRQMFAHFMQQYGYRPPMSLDNMPIRANDWFRYVYLVPFYRLRSKKYGR